MIIGENFQSEYDGYEEDNYDYLFKRKPKAVQVQKRVKRKEKNQQKKFVRKAQGKGLPLLGKRKLPLLGNFGMFDKNKKKAMNTNQVPGSDVSVNTDTSPAVESQPAETTTPEIRIPASSIPSPPLPEPVTTGDATPELTATAETPQKEAEPPVVKITSESAAPAQVGKSSVPGDGKQEVKPSGKKSNPKEAAFSPVLGFVFVGIVVILGGYALFRVNQKSQPITKAA